MTPSSSPAFGAWLRHPAFVPVTLSLSAVFIVAGFAVFIWGFPGHNVNDPSGNTIAIATLKAYAAGAVAKPGVYTLTTDARVEDLLTAAGGPLPEADLGHVNLAAHLFDGAEIYVPRVGEVVSDTEAGLKVNINVASATVMEDQLHIASKTANAIITYREEHGPFTAVAQLLNVVSKAIYDKIKDLVMV